jgi:hypothetical protein
MSAVVPRPDDMSSRNHYSAFSGEQRFEENILFCRKMSEFPCRHVDRPRATALFQNCSPFGFRTSTGSERVVAERCATPLAPLVTYCHAEHVASTLLSTGSARASNAEAC